MVLPLILVEVVVQKPLDKETVEGSEVTQEVAMVTKVVVAVVLDRAAKMLLKLLRPLGVMEAVV